MPGKTKVERSYIKKYDLVNCIPVIKRINTLKQSILENETELEIKVHLLRKLYHVQYDFSDWIFNINKIDFVLSKFAILKEQWRNQRNLYE